MVIRSSFFFLPKVGVREIGLQRARKELPGEMERFHILIMVVAAQLCTFAKRNSAVCTL